MKAKFCIYIAIIVSLITAVSGFCASHTSTKSSGTTNSEELPGLQSGLQHTVKRGDTLSEIAREYGTTTKAIKTANRLTSSRIRTGQVLRIPGSATNASPTVSAPETDSATEEFTSSPEAYSGSEKAADTQPGASRRLKLVQAGFELIGVRYRFGGLGKTGFDCSGLVKTLFSKFNIDLPRSSREQFKQGQKVSRDELEVGDLVFFSSGGKEPTHVGIYVGDDKFLHAARKARQVIVSDINKIWYKVRYLGARRVADLWADEPVQEATN